jgi:outer membrane protein assembly factor BamA
MALIRTRLGVKITDEDLRRDVHVLMADRKFKKVEVITQPTTEGHVIVYFLINERVSAPVEVTEQPLVRVGQIFIVGNTKTPMDVILRRVALFPGQILTYPDLRIAERNLARLNRFVVDRDKGIRPRVIPLPNPNDPDSQFRDILVTVQEKQTTGYLDVAWDEVCDQFERWRPILSLETRVRIAANYLQCLYEAFRR